MRRPIDPLAVSIGVCVTIQCDYLVIGGGTAGCVLAARLSEDTTKRVVLLEAGSSERSPATSDPGGWFGLWDSVADWADQTVMQRGTGAVHKWPRGKVLGGSSSINGMVHMRGHRSSYDRWEELGAHGWNYDALLPYLRRSETAPGRDPRVRGTDGPMMIASNDTLNSLSRAWLDAALDAGYPLSEDGNGTETEGVSWTEMNIVDGRRQSAADAYLLPVLDRANLTVVTDAQVCELRFDGNRCHGARYTVGEGIHCVEAESEVVLCAGAIGTPHLLMLSGIGPAAHLSHNGINVLADVPGVGQNLHDHLMCWITYAAARPLPKTVGAPHVLLRSSSDVDPDLRIALAPIAFGPRWALRQEAGLSVLFALMTPTSRGSVRLTGPRWADPLLIDPAYLTDEHDLDVLVIGLRRAAEIATDSALAPWRGESLDPTLDTTDDDSCRAFIRATVGSFFHPVGTCRIGTDALAVVDAALRVRGVDGLRVADASVIPAIVSATTNATVLAIAERAASLISASHS